MTALISWLLGRGSSASTDAAAEAKAKAKAKADRLLDEGNVLEDGNDPAAALCRYQDACSIAPNYVRVHMNVGNVLTRLERFDEAAASYREGIRVAPDHARIRFNFAGLLATSGDRAGAEEQLRDALRIEPNLAEASVGLALILSTTGREAEAEAQLRTALQHRPDYPGAAHNLGQLLLNQDRFDEAIDWMSLAIEVAPNALSWMLFPLNNRPEFSRSQIFQRHLLVGAAFARRAGPPFDAWANEPDPDRRLCIGYVSADFNLHPVGMLMKPVLEHHRTNNVEIHCYSDNPPDRPSNPVTDALRQLAERWHDTSGLSHDQLAELVRLDGIDILIDLSGHTGNNRLSVFARHPSPVQATWMGYLNTTGLSAMDYRICDRYTDPEGESEAFYTERLVRLPHSQWCYEPWLAPQDFIRDERRSDKIRFGSVNRYTKISDACVELWAEILRREPAAELSILDVPEEHRDALLVRFAAHGVDPARIAILGRQTIAVYLAEIGNLDVALDTIPYNGGTTTLDTLWMGTPMVALKGDRAVSRSSYSILSSLGLPELIADTPAAYVDINLRLASDHAWRSTLRSSLRKRLAVSPLMDADRFVADLESCYRVMWRSWCVGQNRATTG